MLSLSPSRSLDNTTASLPDTRYVAGGKRLLDVALGLLLLLMLAPVFLILVCALRITLGPGVLFRQRRIGRYGKEFSCLKFRTMGQDRRQFVVRFDGTDRRREHKAADDPRHTAIGRVLRKYSLDELPQLLNLIRGDMSLVGPRPEMASVAGPDFVAHQRHLVRPGLTGPYQLSDLRLDGCLKSGLPLDENYVQNISLAKDLGILVRTGAVVLRGTGR